jgi:hypothetical protein
MAKVPGFAKAFAGRWRIAAGFSGKGTTRMTPPAVADQASFAHAAEFFNSLLVRNCALGGDDTRGAIDERVSITRPPPPSVRSPAASEKSHTAPAD